MFNLRDRAACEGGPCPCSGDRDSEAETCKTLQLDMAALQALVNALREELVTCTLLHVVKYF